MKNPHWYYHCNLQTKEAIEYCLLPATYGNMGSVHDFTDETLADLSFAVEHRGFMQEEAAVAAGINPDTMRACREQAREVVLAVVRSQRDHMLVVTDTAAITDRYANLDTVSKNKVAKYRQQLRDITTQDLFQLQWPHLPAELDFVRTYPWPDDIPLSEELRHTLEEPSPEAERQEILDDQWQRIQDIRDARIAGGAFVGGKWFYTDADSISRYLALVIAGPNLMPANIEWKTMDGSKIPMTYELTQQVYVAIMQHTNTVYVRGEQLKEDLYASSNPATFDITVGWPQVYADTLVG